MQLRTPLVTTAMLPRHMGLLTARGGGAGHAARRADS
jgi:hypothetical protein